MGAQTQSLAPMPRFGGLAATLVGTAGAGLLIGTLAGSPSMGFAAVLAVSGALVALVRPDLVVMLVVFLLYSNAAVVAVNSQGLPLLVAAGVPLLLVFPLAHRFLRGEALFFDGVLFALAALLLAMGASGLLARDSGIAVEKIQTFAIQGVLMYFLMLNVLRSRETLRLALWTVLGGAAFLAAVTVFQYITKTFDRPYLGFSPLDIAYFTGYTTEPRAAGPLADPNYYAQILLPAVAFGLVAVLRERGRWLRIAAAAMTMTIMFAIILTSSRGAAIALVAMIVVMVALRFFGFAHLAVSVVVIALAIALNPSYGERLGATSLSGIAAPAGTTVAADQASRSRLTENLAAAHVFADHPLLGVGPGGFPLYYQEYAGRIGIEIHDRARTGDEAGTAPQRAAHNILLGLAADLGVVGVGLFLVVVSLTFAGLLRARRRWLSERRPELGDIAGALIVALTGYLVAGIFLSLAFERYLWLLLALAGATVALSRGSRDACR